MEGDAEADGEQAAAAMAGSSSSPPPRIRPGTHSIVRPSFDCRQRLGSILCSHIGVAIVLCAYCATGAFLFRALEHPAEIEARSRVTRMRDESLEGIWRLGVVTWQDGDPVTDQAKANFTDGLKEVLRRYQQQIGWQGGRGGAADLGFEPDADVVRWSFVGALLYSVTIVTTVGYGHVTPRTNWGRLLTIVYGLIGIPLMVLYLWKMGGLLAEGFRLFYQKVCCDLCCCKRCERARRRRRSGIAYQSRSDALSSSSSYRVGYSRRGRPPSGLAVESPVESSSDPTQGLLTPTENLEFMRGGAGGDAEAATCVNMAFHGSLPRSISRANRDWRTQSSHVYETISLMDDVNSGHVVMKTRPRSYATRPDGRVRYGKGAWSPDQQQQQAGLAGTVKGQGTLERERADRRSGVEFPRDRSAVDRKTPSEVKSNTLPRSSQRRSSSQVRPERRPTRLSTSDGPTTTNSLGRSSKQSTTTAPAPAAATERTEAKPSSSAKQKRPVVSRRPVVTAASPRLLRAKTVPALLLDGRRQKRSANHQNQNQSQSQQTNGPKHPSAQPDRHQRKGSRRRRGTAGTGSPEAEDWPNGAKCAQMGGQSDESFVTAPGDSSSDVVGSTDTGSGEDETRRAVGGVASRRKISEEEPRNKKKRLGSEKRRKRGPEKGEAEGGGGDGGRDGGRGGVVVATAAQHPLTSNSIDDGTEPSKADDPIECHLEPCIYSTSEDDYAAYTNRRCRAPVPICACLMVIVTYVFAGSLGFSLWEGWDYATGPYFCFVTLSTIGFGDFVPGAETRRMAASPERLLVCTVWLLLGLTLLAMCAILITEHFSSKTIVIRSSSRR